MLSHMFGLIFTLPSRAHVSSSSSSFSIICSTEVLPILMRVLYPDVTVNRCAAAPLAIVLSDPSPIDILGYCPGNRL